MLQTMDKEIKILTDVCSVVRAIEECCCWRQPCRLHCGLLPVAAVGGRASNHNTQVHNARCPCTLSCTLPCRLPNQVPIDTIMHTAVVMHATVHKTICCCIFTFHKTQQTISVFARLTTVLKYGLFHPKMNQIPILSNANN